MNGIESLLIVAGISFDIFAGMECQGSLLGSIRKKNLAAVCALVALCQLVMLYAGFFLSSLYCRTRAVPDEHLLGEIIAVAIFFGLGVRLLAKAIRNERVEEHLEKEMGYRRFLHMALISGIYTILTGIAFGFIGTDVLHILVMLAICTVLVVIGGIYTGYRLGYTAKTKVYSIGAILLFAAGIDVLVTRIL